MIKRLSPLLLLFLLLAGCGTQGSYTVQRGDTLSVIAERNKMTIGEIIRINSISNPNHIRAGQTLKVKGSRATVRTSTGSKWGRSSQATSVAATKRSQGPQDHAIQAPKAVASTTPLPKMAGWNRPTQGKIVRTFNPNIPGHKGIQIAGGMNQQIIAANSGEVVYAGSGNSGYGQLIIIKHSNDIYSAYGYLASINVKEGERIASGQSIATMGKSTDNRTILHFEIRVNGNPINPMRYVN